MKKTYVLKSKLHKDRLRFPKTFNSENELVKYLAYNDAVEVISVTSEEAIQQLFEVSVVRKHFFDKPDEHTFIPHIFFMNKECGLENLTDYLEENSLWGVYEFAREFFNMESLVGKKIELDADGNYVTGKAVNLGNKKLIDELAEWFEKDLEPFVIKGTESPFWFKVKNKLIPSQYPSWTRFLYEKYRYFAEGFLVPYRPTVPYKV